MCVKGVVHPKRKIVIIYSPSSFSQTFMSFFLPLDTKVDVLSNVGNHTVDGTHWLFFPTMEVNGHQSTLWQPTFFKISSFVFKRRKKLIHVWFGTTWGWVNDDNFHFWENYPFNPIEVEARGKCIWFIWFANTRVCL